MRKILLWSKYGLNFNDYWIKGICWSWTKHISLKYFNCCFDWSTGALCRNAICHCYISNSILPNCQTASYKVDGGSRPLTQSFHFISKMKKCSISIISQHLLLLKILLLLGMALGDPRTHTIEIMCSKQREHNSTVFVPNFVRAMENISEQMRTSGFGVATTGSGPDTNYGLAQCYGDLSLLDCVLCYAEARTVLPQCFPYTGGRIYLDGCFMRSENYTFYEEFRGSDDRAVCGNTTRKSTAFEESARQVVQRAVESAPSNGGYARGEVSVRGMANESAYVLADCWRTLDENSCRQCLENASVSMLGCLPWSEGRALYTGCFMRYSDRDFLNKEVGNGSSRGKKGCCPFFLTCYSEKFGLIMINFTLMTFAGNIIVIVVSVISSLVVLVVGVAIGFYIWKHRYIQKKRRGKKKRLCFP